MVYIITLSSKMAIYPSRLAQIVSLKVEETLITVAAEYLDYTDIYSEKLAVVLAEHTKINSNTIELEEGKQPPYGPIYSPGPVELETLKTYIETHIKTGFIEPSKSPVGAPILFSKMLDGSFCLCVDYWGFNNLTIKNQYLLPLIGESLDRLNRAKKITVMSWHVT